MSVTIKDIAAIAGVSYSTVSKALNDSPLVKEKTKAKILGIAKQLGYEPNFAAKSLVSKKSNTIGLLWPTVERAAVSTLATLINEELERHSYSMVLSINPIESAIKLFNRIQVDGILVFDESDSSHSLALGSSAIPLLCYGESGLKDIPSINVDRRNAVFKAVHHLWALGHRKIAFIGDVNQRIQQDKYIGFTEGIMKHGLPSHPDMVINTNGLGWQNGYQAAKQLVVSTYKPTAIISASYDTTVGVIRALREAGLQIPKDISLISYDNIPQMANLEVPMTAVGAPMKKIAENIVKFLLSLINNSEEASHYQFVESELVQRESCCPPPQ